MVVGMTVMRKANVVIRDLSALEALGGVTNICSDKTGTLTQGAMIVKKAWIPRVGILTVNNSIDPNDPTQGEVTKSLIRSFKPKAEEEKVDYDQQRSTAGLKFDVPAAKVAKDAQHKEKPSHGDEPAVVNDDIEALLLPTALCNLATVKRAEVEGEANKQWKTTGEPTEIALQVFAHRFDFGRRKLMSEGWKQVAEFPFDSGIKRMSVIYNGPGLENSVVYSKGAVERIIDLCISVGSGEHNEPMTDSIKEDILQQMNALADQGQRVLAVASRTWNGIYEAPKKTDDEFRATVEQDLTLVGLVGIYDPPRDETKDAVRECSEAGIKVHMLTVSQHIIF
jgi:Na+-exporting ATPase